MKINEYLNKKIIMFLITFILIIILLIVSFNLIKKINIGELVDSQSIEVIYENNEKLIKVSDKPLSINDGLFSSPKNTIEIVNKSSKDVKIGVKVIVDDDSLSKDKIYFSVNQIPDILANKKNDIIYEFELKSGESNNFDLRFWPGDDLIDENDLNKTISLKIKYIKNEG